MPKLWPEIMFRVPQFGELLSNAHVFRIMKENLQKKKVQVSSVSADEIVRVGYCHTCFLRSHHSLCSRAVAVIWGCFCAESGLANVYLARTILHVTWPVFCPRSSNAIQLLRKLELSCLVGHMQMDGDPRNLSGIP